VNQRSGGTGTDALVYRVRDAKDAPDGAVVLFHGRGADESDLWPLIDVIDPDRRLLGATPRGPLALPPGGAHWYVVRRVGFPDRHSFDPTYKLTGEWLDAFGRETRIPIEKTVLGGFSQGAVMAYALGLGRGRPQPAGLVCFSGFIPVVEGFEVDLEHRKQLPIAIGHGIYDDVITVDFARDARVRLEEAGLPVVYRESPMPHAIDPAFLNEMPAFVHSAIDRSR
jgi:phospholipase/carboxylesterase